MRIAGRDRLEAFCRRHADARSWIESWLSEVETVAWKTPQDIRNRYGSASFLPGGVVIFNVRGNEYRLEVEVAYRFESISVRWVGTHRAYDERNKRR